MAEKGRKRKYKEDTTIVAARIPISLVKQMPKPHNDYITKLIERDLENNIDIN